MACMCGDSECPSCGLAQGTRTRVVEDDPLPRTFGRYAECAASLEDGVHVVFEGRTGKRRRACFFARRVRLGRRDGPRRVARAVAFIMRDWKPVLALLGAEKASVVRVRGAKVTTKRVVAGAVAGALPELTEARA